MQSYGSGSRIERVAAKLLAGQPIKAFTIGGSVTRGAGATSESTNYPSRFFQFINATFPHRDHVFMNKGIGGTNSGIFAVCADKMLPPDTDIVVAEFTFNENADQPFTHPQRRGFEQLLRKLARLPGAPAVLVLHHYAWWLCAGDGAKSGLYYRSAEQQLTTMAQYYDMPSPSMRTAVWPLMHANIAPFKVSRVLKPGQVSPAGEELAVAEPGTERDYFFYDRVHPSDIGHQVLAELLAGVVLRAVENVLKGGSSGGSSGGGSSGSGSSGDGSGSRGGGSSGDGGAAQASSGLPPPMIPGNSDHASSMCAMQEDFEAVARRMRGFTYLAERPSAARLFDQKWGYTGTAPGNWIELELSTLDGSGTPGEDAATIFLGYLRSYENMGMAAVECWSGCTCPKTVIDGLWKPKISLTQMHTFTASQHRKCTLRIFITERSQAGGSKGGKGSGGGSKFQLNSIMVSHIPVVLVAGQAGHAGLFAPDG